MEGNLPNNMEKPSVFCPNSCGFLDQEYQDAVKAGIAHDVCKKDCWHKDDVEVAPYSITLYTSGAHRERTEEVTVLGENGTQIYVQDKHGISSIQKHSPLIKDGDS